MPILYWSSQKGIIVNSCCHENFNKARQRRSSISTTPLSSCSALRFLFHPLILLASVGIYCIDTLSSSTLSAPATQLPLVFHLTYHFFGRFSRVTTPPPHPIPFPGYDPGLTILCARSDIKPYNCGCWLHVVIPPLSVFCTT